MSGVVLGLPAPPRSRYVLALTRPPLTRRGPTTTPSPDAVHTLAHLAINVPAYARATRRFCAAKVRGAGTADGGVIGTFSEFSGTHGRDQSLHSQCSLTSIMTLSCSQSSDSPLESPREIRMMHRRTLGDDVHVGEVLGEVAGGVLEVPEEVRPGVVPAKAPHVPVRVLTALENWAVSAVVE